MTWSCLKFDKVDASHIQPREVYGTLHRLPLSLVPCSWCCHLSCTCHSQGRMLLMPCLLCRPLGCRSWESTSPTRTGACIHLWIGGGSWVIVFLLDLSCLLGHEHDDATDVTEVASASICQEVGMRGMHTAMLSGCQCMALMSCRPSGLSGPCAWCHETPCLARAASREEALSLLNEAASMPCATIAN